MFYGVVILLISTILAITIRIKSDTQSCIIKKILPYIVLLVGGCLATFVVMINR